MQGTGTRWSLLSPPFQTILRFYDYGISCKAACRRFPAVLGVVGCSIQAWAANKSQLPGLGMGNAEQSCCFLDKIGLLLLPRNSQVQAV